MSPVTLKALQLDNRMNFNLRISNICKSAAKQLNALIRLKNLMKFEEKKILINSYFMANQHLLLSFSLDAIQCKFTQENRKFTEKRTTVFM